MRIVQLTPAFSVGDAVGENAVALCKYFRKQGLDSWIESPDIKTPHPWVKKLDIAGLKGLDERDVVIYHVAVATPYAQVFLGLRAKKVIISHNVTPPEFYSPYSPSIAELLKKTLDEIKFFVENKDRIELFVGVSDYNSSMLKEMGAEAVTVPLVIDWSRFEGEESPYLKEIFRDDKKNFLFVGRVVPNKKIEDLIKFVFYYKEMVSPAVRLIIAGNKNALPKYTFALYDLAFRFHLSDDEVVFTGWIEDDELRSLYRVADLFVSASEHEGFGVPFVEAFYFGVPVLAYRAAAVPETVGDAGLLLETKRPDIWGEAANIILTNKNLREELINKGKKRVNELRSLQPERKLFELITSL